MKKCHTEADAYAALPDDAKWSCSFGYPGDGGFKEYYRAGADSYVIENGPWDGPREWSCTKQEARP